MHNHYQESPPPPLDFDGPRGAVFEGEAGVKANPWGVQLFSKEMAAMRKGGMLTRPCILLEDLTAAFNQPCILDIKMGTKTAPGI